jgi:hypothetical protein
MRIHMRNLAQTERNQMTTTTDVLPDLPESLKRTPPSAATAKQNGDKPVATNGASDAKPPVAAAKPAPAKRATPTGGAKKAKRAATPKPDSNVVTLKALCAELKIEPYDARVKLRAAVADKKIKHHPKSAWEWPKGDAQIKIVRAILKG